MSLFLKIIIFVLVNVLGFYVAPVMLVLLVASGILDVNSSAYIGFGPWFAERVMLSWLACGLFSFSAFFVGGVWRFVFLLAPIMVPLLYGLSLFLMVNP